MKKYFSNCQTIEDVKASFRDWAKKLHPDCGGNAEEFRAMMEEYEAAFERFKNLHRDQNGGTYEKATNETAEQFADIIAALMGLNGICIEIIGSWVWVTGSTYTHRETIKSLGFFWSASKKAWYYNGSSEKSHRRGHYNLNGLRNKWGSTVVENEQRKIS